MFKKSVRIFVKNVHKMGCLEGSGVPVLYIGPLFLKVKTPPGTSFSHFTIHFIGTT
jgi:hypothetical protein